MRFGVVLPRYDIGFNVVRDLALWAEEAGFDSIWVTDHLQPTRGSTLLEPWTLLSALSTLTKRLKLGTAVFCYSYRHPAVLAKMVSTLDRISGGRVELGIGTGSKPQVEEHRAMGIPYPPFSERTRMFRDYVKVLRLLWSRDGRVSYNSPYYPLRDATLDSPPAQENIPIWIGARSPKMLSMAVELGDGWNFYGQTMKEYGRAVKLVNDKLRRLSKPPEELRRAVFTSLSVWEPGESVDEEDLKRRYTLVYGTPEAVLERIEEFRRLGVELLILRDLDPEFRNLKRFASKILPQFRQ